MKCCKCECWNKGIPSDYVEQSKMMGIDIKPDDYGFCDLADDVMFADESCNATEAAKEKRIPLVLKKGV